MATDAMNLHPDLAELDRVTRGHPAVAGARIPGTPLSIQRKVISAIKKALNSAH